MPTEALIALLNQRNAALERWQAQVERARRAGHSELITRWLLQGGLMHRPAVINAVADGLRDDLDRLESVSGTVHDGGISGSQEQPIS